VKEGEKHTYVAVEPHTAMATRIGRPREYQAKAGDSGVFSDVQQLLPIPE